MDSVSEQRSVRQLRPHPLKVLELLSPQTGIALIFQPVPARLQSVMQNTYHKCTTRALYTLYVIRNTSDMQYYLVCPIGTIAGKEDLLTYSSENELRIGAIVEVPFGRQVKQGVVTAETSKPSFTTKNISKTLDEVIPNHLIQLGLWISDYYGARLTTVLQTILPRGLGKNRRLKERTTKQATRVKEESKPHQRTVRGY